VQHITNHMTLGLSHSESCGLLTSKILSSPSPRQKWSPRKSHVLTEYNLLQTHLYPLQTQTTFPHRILHVVIDPNVSCDGLKHVKFGGFLDAIHYAPLYMLVFRATRTHQFAQYRLHQLPWAKDETPHLFNGFITNS
jgi:hypothetical protein